MAIPKLALIPAAQGAKLYSVLPSNGVGDFNFTRGTVATRINSQGLIETVASGVSRLNYPLIDGVVNGCPSHLLEPQRINLIQYSEDFGNSYWTKSGATIEGDASTAGSELITDTGFDNPSLWSTSGTGVVSGSQLTLTGNGGINYVISATGNLFPTTIGKMYKITYTVASNTLVGSSNLVTGNISGGEAFPEHSLLKKEVGVQSTYLVCDATQPTANFSFLINPGYTSGSIVITDISIKEVQGYSVPSVDNPLGAFKLVEDTSTGVHSVYRSNFSVSTQRTFSLFAKKGERDRISIYDTNYFGKKIGVIFNLDSGIVESNQDGTIYLNPEIVSFSNGWYKCSVTWTNASLMVPTIANSISGTNIYTGDGTSGIYIWGAQLEQGSYPTSYIPNYGTALGVTRSAETANGAGDASTFNDSEGVLYFEGSALDDDGTDRKITLSDNSLNNRITIGFSRFSEKINGEIHSGGNIQTAGFGATGVTQTNNNKFALAWGGGDGKFYVNGILASLYTNITSPIGMNVLNFSLSSGFEKMFSNTKDLRVYDTKLNDSDLETLTSWVSFTDMANGQLYTIE